MSIAPHTGETLYDGYLRGAQGKGFNVKEPHDQPSGTVDFILSLATGMPIKHR